MEVANNDGPFAAYKLMYTVIRFVVGIQVLKFTVLNRYWLALCNTKVVLKLNFLLSFFVLWK
jgi:hypothetical protein